MAEQLPALKARWPPASRSCSSSQVMVTELRAPCNGCWSAANGVHVHAPHSEAAHPTTVTLLPFCATAPACLPLAPRLFVHSRRWICGERTASGPAVQVGARQGGPRDQRARSTSRTSVSSQPSPSQSCTRTERGRNARKHRPCAARRGARALVCGRAHQLDCRRGRGRQVLGVKGDRALLRQHYCLWRRASGARGTSQHREHGAANTDEHFAKELGKKKRLGPRA
jgi:hypothetical protein